MIFFSFESERWCKEDKNEELCIEASYHASTLYYISTLFLSSRNHFKNWFLFFFPSVVQKFPIWEIDSFYQNLFNQ